MSPLQKSILSLTLYYPFYSNILPNCPSCLRHFQFRKAIPIQQFGMITQRPLLDEHCSFRNTEDKTAESKDDDVKKRGKKVKSNFNIILKSK